MSANLLQKARSQLNRDDDDDDWISTTSTQPYDLDQDYVVERIVAEAEIYSENDELENKYLVEWQGFDIHEATWEPVEKFQENDSVAVEEWKTRKMREARGLVETFDVDRWEDENDIIEKARKLRKRKRRAKRLRLGLPVYGEAEDDASDADSGQSNSARDDRASAPSRPDSPLFEDAADSSEGSSCVVISARVRSARPRSAPRMTVKRESEESTHEDDIGTAQQSLPTGHPNTHEQDVLTPGVQELSITTRKRDRASVSPPHEEKRLRAADPEPRVAARARPLNIPTRPRAARTSSTIFANIDTPLARRAKKNANTTSAIFPTLQARNAAEKRSRAEGVPQLADADFTNGFAPSGWRRPSADETQDALRTRPGRGTLDGQAGPRAQSPPQSLQRSDHSNTKSSASAPDHIHGRRRSSYPVGPALDEDAFQLSPLPTEAPLTCMEWRANRLCEDRDCPFLHEEFNNPQGNLLDMKKHVTCYFWLSRSCKLSDADCKFAHFLTKYTRIPGKPRLRIAEVEFPDHVHRMRREARRAGVTGIAPLPTGRNEGAVRRSSHSAGTAVADGVPTARGTPRPTTRPLPPAGEPLGCHYFWLTPQGCRLSAHACHFLHDQNGPVYWVAGTDRWMRPIYIGPPDIEERSPEQRSRAAALATNNLTQRKDRSASRSAPPTNSVSQPIENPSTAERTPALLSQKVHISVAMKATEQQIRDVLVLLDTYNPLLISRAASSPGRPVALNFRVVIGAAEFEAYFSAIYKTPLISGGINSDRDSEKALVQLSDSLVHLVSGIICPLPKALLLMHPSSADAWQFLEDRIKHKTSSRFRVYFFDLTNHPTIAENVNREEQLSDRQAEAVNEDVEESFLDAVNISMLTRSAGMLPISYEVFLMIQQADQAFTDTAVSSLRAAGFTVYLNKPGAWRLFLSKVQSGVVIIAPGFNQFDRIPNLRVLLDSQRGTNLFQLASRQEKTKDGQGFELKRLFPSGRAIFILEDCFEKYPHDIEPIVRDIVNRIRPPTGATNIQLVTRPDFADWLFQLMVKDAEDQRRLAGPQHRYDAVLQNIFTMVKSMLDGLPAAKQSEVVHHVPDMLTTDGGTILSPSSDSSADNHSKLNAMVLWFAEWAIHHAAHSRKFVVITKTDSRLQMRWRQQFQHLFVMEPRDYLEMVKREQDEYRRYQERKHSDHTTKSPRTPKEDVKS